MTNEEIKAQLDQVQEFLNQLKAELAGNSTPVSNPTVSGIVAGPNDDGAVKLTKVEAYKPGTWVLWSETLKKYPNLTDKQKATIRVNVGCGDDGSLQPVGPGSGFGGHEGSQAAAISGLVHPAVFGKLFPLPFVKETWHLDYTNALTGTIAVRGLSEDDIVEGLKQIAKGSS